LFDYTNYLENKKGGKRVFELNWAVGARIIYGPKYENWEWKSRTNRELEEMSKGDNIVNWIKGQRISWVGHLERMEEGRMLKKKSSLKKWKGREEGEDPGKDGKRR
jgi:hypothetical protein